MKQLRRAGVCQDDLLYRQLCDLFSNMRAHVGRQVLRKNRRNNLKMFIVVLFRSFGNIPYDEARRTCNILSLAERRHELGKRFFQIIIKDKSNVLFYLLPAKRDVQLTTRLRCARYIQQFMHRLIVIKTLLFYFD